MKNQSLIVGITLLCYSCSSTNLMTLSVVKPAPVTVPANIKTVGVLNRSRASDDNRTIDAVHRTLSLESKDLVAEGAAASITGLTDELMKNNRFTTVKPLSGIDIRSFGAGVFPTPLAWDEVEKICRESNTDALFALELFDTESKMSYSGGPTSIHTGIANIPAIENLVSMSTTVRTGWRIYDPASRNILDEYVINRDISTSGKGINPAVAGSALIGRKEAVKQVGLDAGQCYASRIISYWIRVSRNYFVGGDSQFSVAKRKAQSGNWDGAAEIWQEETKSPNGKLAGRACYNMAIISEIHGDLDAALQWAQKSYENYNIRLALDYVNILNRRKIQNAVLETQQVATSTN